MQRNGSSVIKKNQKMLHFQYAHKRRVFHLQRNTVEIKHILKTFFFLTKHQQSNRGDNSQNTKVTMEMRTSKQSANAESKIYALGHGTTEFIIAEASFW